MLEETKSSVMAQRQAALGDIPVNRAEQTVKASQEWFIHLTKIVDAKTMANEAHIKLKYTEMKYYEQQRKDANQRAEMKMLGGTT